MSQENLMLQVENGTISNYTVVQGFFQGNDDATKAKALAGLFYVYLVVKSCPTCTLKFNYDILSNETLVIQPNGKENDSKHADFLSSLMGLIQEIKSNVTLDEIQQHIQTTTNILRDELIKYQGILTYKMLQNSRLQQYLEYIKLIDLVQHYHGKTDSYLNVDDSLKILRDEFSALVEELQAVNVLFQTHAEKPADADAVAPGPGTAAAADPDAAAATTPGTAAVVNSDAAAAPGPGTAEEAAAREEEAARKRAEEEEAARKRAEEEEAARKQAEEEAARKQAEEEAARKQAEEAAAAARKQAEEAAAVAKAAEEAAAAARKQAEEAAAAVDAQQHALANANLDIANLNASITKEIALLTALKLLNVNYTDVGIKSAISTAETAVKAATSAVEEAKKAVKAAKKAVEAAETAVQEATSAVEAAKKAVEDAIKIAARIAETIAISAAKAASDAAEYATNTAKEAQQKLKAGDQSTEAKTIATNAAQAATTAAEAATTAADAVKPVEETSTISEEATTQAIDNSLLTLATQAIDAAIKAFVAAAQASAAAANVHVAELEKEKTQQMTNKSRKQSFIIQANEAANAANDAAKRASSITDTNLFNATQAQEYAKTAADKAKQAQNAVEGVDNTNRRLGRIKQRIRGRSNQPFAKIIEEQLLVPEGTIVLNDENGQGNDSDSSNGNILGEEELEKLIEDIISAVVPDAPATGDSLPDGDASGDPSQGPPNDLKKKLLGILKGNGEGEEKRTPINDKLGEILKALPNGEPSGPDETGETDRPYDNLRNIIIAAIDMLSPLGSNTATTQDATAEAAEAAEAAKATAEAVEAAKAAAEAAELAAKAAAEAAAEVNGIETEIHKLGLTRQGVEEQQQSHIDTQIKVIKEAAIAAVAAATDAVAAANAAKKAATVAEEVAKAANPTTDHAAEEAVEEGTTGETAEKAPTVEDASGNAAKQAVMRATKKAKDARVIAESEKVKAEAAREKAKEAKQKIYDILNRLKDLIDAIKGIPGIQVPILPYKPDVPDNPSDKNPLDPVNTAIIEIIHALPPPEKPTVNEGLGVAIKNLITEVQKLKISNEEKQEITKKANKLLPPNTTPDVPPPPPDLQPLPLRQLKYDLTQFTQQNNITEGESDPLKPIKDKAQELLIKLHNNPSDETDKPPPDVINDIIELDAMLDDNKKRNSVADPSKPANDSLDNLHNTLKKCILEDFKENVKQCIEDIRVLSDENSLNTFAKIFNEEVEKDNIDLDILKDILIQPASDIKRNQNSVESIFNTNKSQLLALLPSLPKQFCEALSNIHQEDDPDAYSASDGDTTSIPDIQNIYCNPDPVDKKTINIGQLETDITTLKERHKHHPGVGRAIDLAEKLLKQRSIEIADEDIKTRNEQRLSTEFKLTPNYDCEQLEPLEHDEMSSCTVGVTDKDSFNEQCKKYLSFPFHQETCEMDPQCNNLYYARTGALFRDVINIYDTYKHVHTYLTAPDVLPRQYYNAYMYFTVRENLKFKPVSKPSYEQLQNPTKSVLEYSMNNDNVIIQMINNDKPHLVYVYPDAPSFDTTHNTLYRKLYDINDIKMYMFKFINYIYSNWESFKSSQEYVFIPYGYGDVILYFIELLLLGKTDKTVKSYVLNYTLSILYNSKTLAKGQNIGDLYTNYKELRSNQLNNTENFTKLNITFKKYAGEHTKSVSVVIILPPVNGYFETNINNYFITLPAGNYYKNDEDITVEYVFTYNSDNAGLSSPLKVTLSTIDIPILEPFRNLAKTNMIEINVKVNFIRYVLQQIGYIQLLLSYNYTSNNETKDLINLIVQKIKDVKEYIFIEYYNIFNDLAIDFIKTTTNGYEVITDVDKITNEDEIFVGIKQELIEPYLDLLHLDEEGIILKPVLDNTYYIITYTSAPKQVTREENAKQIFKTILDGIQSKHRQNIGKAFINEITNTLPSKWETDIAKQIFSTDVGNKIFSTDVGNKITRVFINANEHNITDINVEDLNSEAMSTRSAQSSARSTYSAKSSALSRASSTRNSASNPSILDRRTKPATVKKGGALGIDPPASCIELAYCITGFAFAISMTERMMTRCIIPRQRMFALIVFGVMYTLFLGVIALFGGMSTSLLFRHLAAFLVLLIMAIWSDLDIGYNLLLSWVLAVWFAFLCR